MPQSKTYYRKCEMCGYECRDSSNWSKHQKTKKHLQRIQELEDKNKLLEVKLLETENELLKLKLQNAGTTINNIDNSNTNIQINVFTPNPNANNLNDIIIPTLKEMAEREDIPSVAIQKVIMAMEERVRPILYHKNILYVKQDEWKQDQEAEKELNKFCNNKYTLLNEEFLNMDTNLDSVFYDRCMEYAMMHPLDKDTITHKVKTKLIQQ